MFKRSKLGLYNQIEAKKERFIYPNILFNSFYCAYGIFTFKKYIFSWRKKCCKKVFFLDLEQHL